MFKLQLAQYINDNMVKHNLTYKDIASRSGVPPTTLSYYARGMVNTPSDEYCAKIAAVFGDGPEVIQRMRRDALGSTAEENKLIAGSTDQERMEAFAAQLRAAMVQILEDFREQSAAQQTEILQHTDRRVENAHRRASELNAKVLQQCQEEIDRHKQHNAELLALKDQMISTIQDERERVRAYLKRIIRNLTIALIAVSLIAACGVAVLGGYAFYAYNAFDRQDPTRGLYRAEVTPEPTADAQTVLEVENE